LGKLTFCDLMESLGHLLILWAVPRIQFGSLLSAYNSCCSAALTCWYVIMCDKNIFYTCVFLGFITEVEIQGEHKVFPGLRTFITRKLRGIQTFFFSNVTQVFFF